MELAGHEIGTVEMVVHNLPAVNPSQIRISVYSMGASRNEVLAIILFPCF